MKFQKSSSEVTFLLIIFKVFKILCVSVIIPSMIECINTHPALRFCYTWRQNSTLTIDCLTPVKGACEKVVFLASWKDLYYLLLLRYNPKNKALQKWEANIFYILHKHIFWAGMVVYSEKYCRNLSKIIR